MKLDKIEKLYSENIEKYGIDSRAVGWNSEDSQYLRFEKLLQVIEDKSQSFTINELGCGYGELYKYLKNKNYNFSSFNGYDISQPMLDSCKLYLNDPKNLKLFNSSNIKSVADYTVTSGIFNVNYGVKNTKWEEYIKETLKDMFSNSKKGISFNMLTSYVEYEAENLFYADPMKYFDFCKSKLSKSVTLLHDYPLYEWTLIVKK